VAAPFTLPGAQEDTVMRSSSARRELVFVTLFAVAGLALALAVAFVPWYSGAVVH
jgi:hypothetical protein